MDISAKLFKIGKFKFPMLFSKKKLIKCISKGWFIYWLWSDIMITVDVFLLFIHLKSIKSHWYLQSKWYYSCRLKNWNLCLYFCLRNGFSGRTSFNTFKHISLHIESCCCMWHPINTYKNYETQPGIQINSQTSNPLSDLVEMDLIRTSN